MGNGGGGVDSGRGGVDLGGKYLVFGPKFASGCEVEGGDETLSPLRTSDGVT